LSKPTAVPFDFIRIGVQHRKEKTLLELEKKVRWKFQPRLPSDFESIRSAIRFAQELYAPPVESRGGSALIDPLLKRSARGVVLAKRPMSLRHLYVSIRITIVATQAFASLLQSS